MLRGLGALGVSGSRVPETENPSPKNPETLNSAQKKSRPQSRSGAKLIQECRPRHVTATALIKANLVLSGKAVNKYLQRGPKSR